MHLLFKLTLTGFLLSALMGSCPLGSVDTPHLIHLGKSREGHVSSPQSQILCFFVNYSSYEMLGVFGE